MQIFYAWFVFNAAKYCNWILMSIKNNERKFIKLFTVSQVLIIGKQVNKQFEQ